jgi:hypothetical protein
VTLGAQGKLGKDAGSEVCSTHERPRTPIQRSHARTGRLIETTLLVLVGVLLAAATINDVVRQTHVNHRLVADLRTWRAYTHHDYVNISIDQETFGLESQREVLCGNTSPGPPGSRTQICLAIWGSVVNGRRTVHGGWYLPPYKPDLPADRYGCYGSAGAGMCPG